MLANCHGVMHTVGRTYALERGRDARRPQDYLPRSNDPGCSAGFAHGLVTGVAPSIDPRRPREAATVCADAGTRYRRYSCVHGLGHAFMRIYGDRLTPALGLCRALGRAAPPTARRAPTTTTGSRSSAQTTRRCPTTAVTDPRELCASQPAAFVRPCWYRAFVDNRPGGHRRRLARASRRALRRPRGLQREACITAASVIGPADPAEQLEICAQLPVPGDAASCVRGAKVQNLLGAPTDAFVRLIGRCELFSDAHPRRRATAGSARRSPSSPTAASPAPAARGSPARGAPRVRCRRAQRWTKRS